MHNNSINGNTLQCPLGTGEKAEVWKAKSNIGRKSKISRAVATAALLIMFMGPNQLIGAVEAGDQPSGMFSVSPNKTVYFAQGNLQYQASTGKWRIAPNPWDASWENNGFISPTYKGWIDLFGWGTGDAPTKSSWEDSDYSKFVDWGGKVDKKWYTPTKEEWDYVFNLRATPSGIRFAMAKVNGVPGVVLLPDNWSASKYTLRDTNKQETDCDNNTLSAAVWNKTFSPAGAVFLPCAGARYGDMFDEVGRTYGAYWASNECTTLHFWTLGDLSADYANYSASNGCSVRLICTAEVVEDIPEEEILNDEIFQIVEEMPQFPGGEAKMTEFISKNIEYPQTAQDSGIQGRVFVSFVVEPDGSTSNVKVLRGIGGGCDEEAIRVVSSMPKWKPGKQRGKLVRVAYQIPVFFKLQ